MTSQFLYYFFPLNTLRSINGKTTIATRLINLPIRKPPYLLNYKALYPKRITSNPKAQKMNVNLMGLNIHQQRSHRRRRNAQMLHQISSHKRYV